MRKIAFLVLPEFSYLGLAAAMEPLFVANWLAQRTLFEWQVVSVDGKPVRASNGREVPVDGPLAAADDCKTAFVLASFDPQRLADKRPAVRWVKRMARFGVEIGGIENGGLILAEAGLLNGHPAAIHWDNLIGFQEHYPKAQALPQLFVRSREVITCAGAAAILDLMVAWMGWHGEAELAREVAEHLLMGRPRAADTAQRMVVGGNAAVTDVAVFKARALMAVHVEDPLTCEAIARHVGLSLRQLERRFQDQRRCSVLQDYRQIRMAKAHQLLQQTDLSVTQVAFACGFGSPEYFCRLYREIFGCSPSRDRRQSTTAPVLRQRVNQ
jgi:AraC family transcriptional regulator, carnitine catabolism transcriptional activator